MNEKSNRKQLKMIDIACQIKDIILSKSNSVIERQSMQEKWKINPTFIMKTIKKKLFKL